MVLARSWQLFFKRVKRGVPYVCLIFSNSATLTWANTKMSISNFKMQNDCCSTINVSTRGFIGCLQRKIRPHEYQRRRNCWTGRRWWWNVIMKRRRQKKCWQHWHWSSKQSCFDDRRCYDEVRIIFDYHVWLYFFKNSPKSKKGLHLMLPVVQTNDANDIYCGKRFISIGDITSSWNIWRDSCVWSILRLVIRFVLLYSGKCPGLGTWKWSCSLQLEQLFFFV